ncbi:hypothetical protein DDR33_00605 [Pararcticibacter amylolyticus]|uniref:Uncharacterized protein n=1 Tax=Pararcticibacter amylolyticus TaxID=2173175 RepID=A0A2U2PLX3_9SPHI|nr:hypothetical protein DDR33_00605 [Pararcticibacter amylolyticus]
MVDNNLFISFSYCAEVSVFFQNGKLFFHFEKAGSKLRLIAGAAMAAEPCRTRKKFFNYYQYLKDICNFNLPQLR